jgi:hypothetical protein
MGDEPKYHACPVCGLGLDFAPWDGGSASDEICPCCFIQFGYDDFAGGDLNLRRETYAQWRQKWIAEGMPWRGSRKPPEAWAPATQVSRVLEGR